MKVRLSQSKGEPVIGGRLLGQMASYQRTSPETNDE